MSYELTGQLEVKFDTQQVNDRFKKREFVIRTDEERGDRTFTDYIKFQLLQDRVDLIDAYEPGQNLKVHFDLKGNRWEKNGNVNYFTNLNAWRIEDAGAGAPSGPGGDFETFPAPSAASDAPSASPSSAQEEDDLPF